MEQRRAGAAPSRGAESFGARLRELREAAGLTQEELALKAGLSPNAVAALEQGRRKRPYPHTVRSLAEALGLSEGERKSLLASVPGRGETASPAAPPATPEAAPSTALPHPAIPLLGRERELAEVKGLLLRPDVRLVTLTGIGGVGKTRLALEAARGAAGDFADGGAAFVGLASLADPTLVVPTISRSLGVPEAEGRTPSEALTDHLRDKSLLLVLDNLEHLLDAAPEVAGLVESCPGLVVLATSRAPLRIRGEMEYPVAPLALPTSTRSPDKEEVLAAPSGRLFVERARAVSPGFTLTRDNASSVAAICWRLAGIPLALELAAAKARLLDPAALLARLDEALSAAGARDLPERQRTMRAALDWSHALLSGRERGLLRRLSVFAGGFSLEAAEALGATDGGDGEEVLDLLGGLVEQSLVEAKPDPEGDGARYGMLEPVRQYAFEKLEESGEAEETRRRHARYFLALVEAAEPELRGPRQAEWLRRIETEHGNIRGALRWSFEGGEAGLGADLASAAWLFWYYRGHLEEGRTWLEVAASVLDPTASGRKRALLLDSAAVMALVQTRYGAAKALLDEALPLFRELGDDEGTASCLAHLGLAAAVGGQDQASVPRLLQELLVLRPKLANGRIVAEVLAFCGMASLGLGETERGEAMLEESLALYRETRDARGACLCLTVLGTAALMRGDEERGHAFLAENLRLAYRSGDRLAFHYSLLGLAEVAFLGRRPVRAASLWGAAEGTREAHDLELPRPVRSGIAYEAHLAAVRSELGEEAFAAAWEEGRAMALEEAVTYALGRDVPDLPDVR